MYLPNNDLTINIFDVFSNDVRCNDKHYNDNTNHKIDNHSDES